MTTSNQSRRKFIKSSLAGATGAAAVGFQPSVWSAPIGSNSDIRVGIVGVRGKGNSHLSDFRKVKGARIAGICDVDSEVLAGRKASCEKNKEKVNAQTDMRKLFDDKDIDVIVISAPNHWHSLASIWAMEAGKHVYCEKPVSHNIWEGRQLTKAAERLNKICQCGTQSRSDPGVQEAYAWLKEGEIGKPLLARGTCYKRRGSIGKVTEPLKIPDYIDFDLWCGPAEKKPIMRKNLHYDWHWVWNTGNGDVGNQGIHQMDVARWMIDEPKLAPSVFSVGGRLGYIDDGETPNTQFVYFDYKPVPLIFEVRGLPQKKDMKAMDRYMKANPVGNLVHCEGGWMTRSTAYDKDGKRLRTFKGDGGGGHQANFIKAVREGKREILNAWIGEGHISSALCHMGNISHMVGKEAGLNEIAERMKGNQWAMETFERFKAHIGANEVDLEKTPTVLGPVLQFDPDKEEFTGEMADKANKYVSRDYRAPYIVPAQV